MTPCGKGLRHFIKTRIGVELKLTNWVKLLKWIFSWNWIENHISNSQNKNLSTDRTRTYVYVYHKSLLARTGTIYGFYSILIYLYCACRCYYTIITIITWERDGHGDNLKRKIECVPTHFISRFNLLKCEFGKTLLEYASTYGNKYIRWKSQMIRFDSLGWAFISQPAHVWPCIYLCTRARMYACRLSLLLPVLSEFIRARAHTTLRTIETAPSPLSLKKSDVLKTRPNSNGRLSFDHNSVGNT